MPISDEYTTADGKIRQDFERGSTIYDEKASAPWQIYAAAIGDELVATRKELAAAQHQADLDAQIIAQQQARITELEGQVAAMQQAPAPAPAAPDVASVVTPQEIAQAASQALAAAQAAVPIAAASIAAPHASSAG